MSSSIRELLQEVLQEVRSARLELRFLDQLRTQPIPPSLRQPPPLPPRPPRQVPPPPRIEPPPRVARFRCEFCALEVVVVALDDQAGLGPELRCPSCEDGPLWKPGR